MICNAYYIVKIKKIQVMWEYKNFIKNKIVWVILMKVGLCLAGGGVKGAAHIGVIKALEEENINIDCISGTSSGSIVAVLYAAGYTSNEIIKIFGENAKKIKYIDFRNILNIIKNFFKTHKFIIEGFNSGETIEKIINKYCKEKGIINIRDINKNVLIASVSLNSGNVCIFESIKKEYRYSDEIVHIKNIEIGKAVRASCSYPGVFCPCKVKNDVLIDGGVRENVPWKELKNIGVDDVICVTFEENKKYKKDKNIIDVISSSINLMGRELSNYEIDGVDYLLKIKTKEISLLDSSEIDYLYSQGYFQMKRFLKEIKLNN